MDIVHKFALHECDYMDKSAFKEVQTTLSIDTLSQTLYRLPIYTVGGGGGGVGGYRPLVFLKIYCLLLSLK